MLQKRKFIQCDKTSKYFKGSARKRKDAEDKKLIGTSHLNHVARLGRSFFDQPGLDLAKNLLGKKLVRKLDDGSRVSGIIVETEAYLGRDDKACHSYSGKVTARNAAMFMVPGTSYVYFTYGMYYCLNISCKGDGCCVLLRALKPVEGQDHMTKGRNLKRKGSAKSLKTKELSNGPSKLCQALFLDKENFNAKDLTTFGQLWIENGETVPSDGIVTSTRIGIDGAGEEYARKPWRFYVKGEDCVSKRDKVAESEGAKDTISERDVH